MIYRVEFKNNFLASSPIKRALRMCYSEPLYEEGKKQLNPTSSISISEEISSGLREILRCTIMASFKDTAAQSAFHWQKVEGH